MAAVVITPAHRSPERRAPTARLDRPESTAVLKPCPSVADGPRLDASVYRRRRLLALVAALMLSGMVVVGVVRVADAALSRLSTPTSAVAPPPAPTAAVASELAGVDVYIVEPGDSLWSIAERLAPGEDPRPIVDRLAERAGGSVLRPGQRLSLAGLR